MKSLCIYQFDSLVLETIKRGVPFLAIGVERTNEEYDEDEYGENQNEQYHLDKLRDWGAKVEIIGTVKNPKYIGKNGHMLEVAWVTFPSNTKEK